MKPTVAFIGLGAMGYRMAAHLPQHFDTVMVWNRNFAKAQQHAAQYATLAVELQQAAQADLIFSCLPTSADIDTILAQVQCQAGSIWIDCTSGVPEAAQRQAALLKQQGVSFLDAPVSGQTIGAEKASLTFMVGGEADAFERAVPAMQAMGHLIRHVGQSGSGFAVKAVNNMMMAVHLCAAAEGFTTLKAHGVNLQQALDCINASSGKSGVTESALPDRILNRSFPLTFALGLLAKDTGIAIDLVHEAKLSAPVTAVTQSLIQAAYATSEANSDFSAAVKMYESWSKITIE
ncbi:NAD(P)-dependent oxidoreductase [Acinetobacter rudis]|uniref:3-hydroxyisobutyrate dehydrogenase n=1 Tax=Acinetobacter rudis CIP 110305 TaxID=421052 RepID=S3MX40_9GAMM|nr:NAD(P)-dependent oxidoreductase [Acinetobacter rudis]EPF72017.1 3-hydroxyisobutyrate dehydrogenase [Acinetobacter rudis CIP 110305]